MAQASKVAPRAEPSTGEAVTSDDLGSNSIDSLPLIPKQREVPATGQRSSWARAVRELVLVTVLFLIYKAGRIFTAGHTREAHDNAASVWHFERALHFPHELDLQHALMSAHWLVVTANSYYAYVHFPATIACLIWLYMRRPALYRQTRRVLAWLTATALAVHVLYPLAPPRLTSGTGLLDTGALFGPGVYGPPDTDTLSNQYAAMPSLHVGWAVVVAVALAVAIPGRWRWLWLAHPVITLLVVVGTGNHYWLDALVALVLLGVAALLVLPTARRMVADAGSWLRRRWLRVLAWTAAIVAMVLALHGRIPDPGSVVVALGDADPRWLVVAVLAQFCSQAAFAKQQRTLLAALAVALSRRAALAITYSRSAMSMVLPAGSAMSAAFAVKQYRRYGATTAVAATGMVLSGAASLAGLILLYIGVVSAWALVGLAAAGVVGCAIVLRRRRLPRVAVTHWAKGRFETVRKLVREARAVRLRHWAATIAFAMLNWLLDLACLIAIVHACGLSLSVLHVATVYLAAQVVRQIPLTPGGAGLIEASLLAGLVAAGAPQAAAAAVVLGYRLVSFWLLLPAGLAAYLRLTRFDRTPAAAEA
ncbi:flippase-like domain-containing protein [Actinoplanes sp. TFC3]|uniref:flippase-like domain-containing protein n=1 Tax=Actinoplanes sp. TFC3 TaxID=1710355 RepID=UPI0008353A76|nr:flippase-like domain-containing protein [Actinoplanes sp. TFC3]